MTIDPLFDPAVVEDPYGYYEQLRTDDPVHEVTGTGTFLVSRMDLIREVVNRPDVFSSACAVFLHHRAVDGRPGLQGPVPGVDFDLLASGSSVLATADPPDHTRQRKVISQVLSQRAMREMEPEFRELVGGVLDQAVPAGHIEWMSELAEPLPMLMVSRILGVSDEVAPRVQQQGYAAVEAISGFIDAERLAVVGAPMMDVGPVVDVYQEVREHLAELDPGTLIGACAGAVEAGELTDVEAIAMLFLLVSAGGESTTSLTGSSVRLLAERPDLQERLRAEPSLIPAFVEEACRLDPPFRGHYRKVLADTEVGGVDVPAGSHVVLLWPAANHDPAAFADADDIDLDRPNPRQHVGFGWGIHLCVGAPLARIEAKVAIEELLARTRSFTLDVAPASLRHHRSLMIRRLVELPLTLEAAP